MSRAHARRKPSREGSKTTAHPGQARSAPRKRAYRQQKMLRVRQELLTRTNYAQKWQDKVDCHIIIRGLDNWKTIFNFETVKVKPSVVKYFGTDEPSLLDYLRVNSDLNKVSFERSVIGELLAEGFELEALEVEFLNPAEKTWGVCKWYYCHHAYEEPLPDMFKGLDPSLFKAMFKTQYAGDQQFCLYSTQFGGGVLLHKSIVFRKVILRKPTHKMSQAA